MGQRTLKADELIEHLATLRDAMKKGDRVCFQKAEGRRFTVRTRIKRRPPIDGGARARQDIH